MFNSDVSTRVTHLCTNHDQLRGNVTWAVNVECPGDSDKFSEGEEFISCIVKSVYQLKTQLEYRETYARITA